MDGFANLGKKERKKLKKKLQEKERQRKERNKRLVKIALLITIIFIFLLGGYFFIKRASTPQPGQLAPDLGREHVPVGFEVEYNTNPPTSGPHYDSWEKAGIYTTPLDDRKLVHSLEHGYVIISYNCQGLTDDGVSRFSFYSYAHQETEEPIGKTTGSIEEQGSIILDEWQKNKDCQELVSKLAKLAEKHRLWKLIVVPRLDLDTHIALTAWRRIDKFNTFDEERISSFIKAYRDRGPEKTME